MRWIEKGLHQDLPPSLLVLFMHTDNPYFTRFLSVKYLHHSTPYNTPPCHFTLDLVLGFYSHSHSFHPFIITLHHPITYLPKAVLYCSIVYSVGTKIHQKYRY